MWMKPLLQTVCNKCTIFSLSDICEKLQWAAALGKDWVVMESNLWAGHSRCNPLLFCCLTGLIGLAGLTPDHSTAADGGDAVVTPRFIFLQLLNVGTDTIQPCSVWSIHHQLSNVSSTCGTLFICSTSLQVEINNVCHSLNPSGLKRQCAGCGLTQYTADVQMVLLIWLQVSTHSPVT